MFLAFPVASYAKKTQVSYSADLPETVRDAIEERMPDDGQIETALQARRLARTSRTLARNTLNSFGYYDPKIEIEILATGQKPEPSLIIDPGPLFRIDRSILRYQGAPPREEDLQLIEDAMPIRQARPAIPADIIDAERVLAQKLRELGYPFAKVIDRDVIGDQDRATISVRYNIDSGARVQFGDMIYPDDIRTKPKYLARINPVKSGEIYDPKDLALYNSRLSETRLFDSSLARLSEEPLGSTDSGDAIYDVIVDIDERKRNTLALGGNYGTDEGFGVNAELTRRNLTRRGDLLIAETRIAQREIGLDLTWRRPNELGYGKGLILNASALDENTDAFDQQTFRLGAGYEVIKGPKLTYNFGMNGQIIRQDELDRIQNFQTLSAYGGINIDQSDSLLDPRRGWRAEGRIVPTYAFGGDEGDRQYVRGVVQGRAYLPFGDKDRFVAAGRVRLGTLIGADAEDVPAESRFYAGGGGSVRGYGFQAIGPFQDDVPLGGRSLLDASIEGRFRINNRFGAVAFVDAGNVSDELYPRFENLRLGAGVGIRYVTPAGPIRFDVATPLNPSDRDEPVQVYISIGQAF